MKIYRHLPKQQVQAHALAIGNFDGLHLGHQALLSKTVKMANNKQLAPAVMTFEPHPREFFNPKNAPARLSSLREKLEYFYEAGITHAYVLRFNQRFAAVTADDFMHNVLHDALRAKTIFVGGDFCFGAKRQGTVQHLIEAGFDLVDFPQIEVDGIRVSSTIVREALAAGDLNLAHRYLGRPYSISGKVVKGAQRGRTMGYPTANVHMRHERPAFTGVYAVKLDGKLGIANLGVRPTIAGIPKLMLEVHVFDFDGDLYDEHVHVQFFYKVREEKKFDSLDALIAQIVKDVVVAKDYFKKTQ